MQTGAQLTAGFLLTLPFTTKFPSLDDFQADPVPDPRARRGPDHRPR